MRNDRQAHLTLLDQSTSMSQKVEQIMSSSLPYKERLALVLELDKNKGKLR